MDQKHKKHVSALSYRELKYIPLIYLSCIIFTTPWTLHQLFENISATTSKSYIKYGLLLIYSFGFYLPACVPIHVWMRTAARKVGPYEEEEECDASVHYPAISPSMIEKKGKSYGKPMPVPKHKSHKSGKAIFSYSYKHK